MTTVTATYPDLKTVSIDITKEWVEPVADAFYKTGAIMVSTATTE